MQNVLHIDLLEKFSIEKFFLVKLTTNSALTGFDEGMILTAGIEIR